VHLLKHTNYDLFYKDRVADGKYVILDNSTVELGEPWPMQQYLASAMRLGASEILLPDWLYNITRTLDAAESGLRWAEEAGYSGQIMGIPQGNTQEEWVECLEEMLGMGISSIGISRRYLDKFGTSRLLACYATHHVASSMNIAVSIHLLGAGLPPEVEVAPCLRLPYVVGVDSAMPSYFAKAGQKLGFNAVRPEAQRDLENDVYSDDLLAVNIGWWRQLCAQQ
ncbi:hypothetical protein LCGC14_2559130, partial [marine sediment metagenome]